MLLDDEWQKRSTSSGELLYRSLWDQLPHDLSASVLDKLERCFNEDDDGRSGLQSILTQRLVSSSWKDAVAAYRGGKITLDADRQSDLKDLAKTLPNIRELSIQGKSAKDDQHEGPFPSLFWYLSPSSRGDTSSEEEECLDMSLLPENLMGLSLSHCSLELSSFRNMRCAGLTSLKLDHVQNLPREKSKLMQYLPRLQV